MENQIIDKKETLDDVVINNGLPVWGLDANPENDPTYSMKKRTNEEHQGYSWVRPTQQVVDVEILHSNERPNVTSVFGTSTPPYGLSGRHSPICL